MFVSTGPKAQYSRFFAEDLANSFRGYAPRFGEIGRGEVLLIDNEIGVRLTLVDEWTTAPQAYGWWLWGFRTGCPR